MLLITEFSIYKLTNLMSSLIRFELNVKVKCGPITTIIIFYSFSQNIS